jgi:hypothetical protein
MESETSPHGKITARWLEWSDGGLQHLELVASPSGFVARAHVIGTEDNIRFAARYEITLDGQWRTRSLVAEVLGGVPRIVLAGDGEGNWSDADGRAVEALAGAIDVDLPITPFTNTLPIRRLGLATGQSMDLRIAYVRVTLGIVEIDPQRYTCLEEGRRFRYESLDSDFKAEIAVDGDGLVLDYPELFRRVA